MRVWATAAESTNRLKSHARATCQSSLLLQALWYDGRGDWNRAHELAQDVDDANGAWVDAYLHRKEGDPSNARYWYRRAQPPEPPMRSMLNGLELLQRC